MKTISINGKVAITSDQQHMATLIAAANWPFISMNAAEAHAAKICDAIKSGTRRGSVGDAAWSVV